MNATTRERLEKAQADLATAEREVVVDDRPNYDGVYFHAQQASEKMMKAVLIHRRVLAPRTHDLVIVAEELHKLGCALAATTEELRELNRGAVFFRYPTGVASAEDARKAVVIARAIMLSAGRCWKVEERTAVA